MILKTRTISLLALIMAFSLLLLAPTAAVKAEVNAGNYITAPEEDGNAKVARDVTIPKDVEHDVYAAGMNVTMKDSKVGGSALITGYSLDVEGSEIDGSLREAGYNLRIMGDKVGGNITVAGRNVTVDGETTSNAVYATGDVVTLRGSTTDINAVGGTVILGGEVKGNAVIYCDTLEIENGAKIDGVVDVRAASNPVVGDKAEVGKINVSLTVPEPAESLADQVINFLVSIAYWACATILTGFLIMIFMGPTVRRSTEAVRNHPLAVMLSGFIGIILIPIALIIIAITYVGLPLAGSLFLIYISLLFFSVAFAGVSIFRLIMPKIHWIVPCVLGCLVAALLSNIPYVNTVIDIVCLSYTLGCILVVLYSNMVNAFSRRSKASKV